MPKTPLENRLDEVNDTIQDIIDDCNEILDDKHITRIESLADIPETLGNMSGGGSGGISSVDTTQGLGTRQVVDPETGNTTQQAFAKVDGTTIKFNSNGQMQADIKTPEFIVVAELPVASAQTMGDIYLVPSASSKTKNVKDEFITIEDSGTYEWEQIGSTAVDLSNYYTKTEADALLDDKLDIADIDNELSATSENPVQNKVITAKIANLEQYFGYEPISGAIDFICKDSNNNYVAPPVNTASNVGRDAGVIFTKGTDNNYYRIEVYPPTRADVEYMFVQREGNSQIALVAYNTGSQFNSSHSDVKYYIYAQGGGLVTSGAGSGYSHNVVPNTQTGDGYPYFIGDSTWLSGPYYGTIIGTQGFAYYEGTYHSRYNSTVTDYTSIPAQYETYTINANVESLSPWDSLNQEVERIANKQEDAITNHLNPLENRFNVVFGDLSTPSAYEYPPTKTNFKLPSSVPIHTGYDKVLPFFNVKNSSGEPVYIEVCITKPSVIDVVGYTATYYFDGIWVLVRNNSSATQTLTYDVFWYDGTTGNLLNSSTNTVTILANLSKGFLPAITCYSKYMQCPDLRAETSGSMWNSATANVSSQGNLFTTNWQYTVNAGDPTVLTPWEQINYDVEHITASDVDSESATNGYVLTADGNGGASWQAGGGGSYTLPTATTSTLGGIKPDGTTIVVDSSTGVASAVGGGGGTVDTAISPTSTNAVQNKVIAQYLEPVLGVVPDPSAQPINIITATGDFPPTYDFVGDGYDNVIIFVSDVSATTSSSKGTNVPTLIEIGFKFNSGTADVLENLDFVYTGNTSFVAYDHPWLMVKSKTATTYPLNISGIIKYYTFSGVESTLSVGSYSNLTFIDTFDFNTTVTSTAQNCIPIFNSWGNGISTVLTSGADNFKYFSQFSCPNIPTISTDGSADEWDDTFVFNNTGIPTPWETVNNKVTTLESNVSSLQSRENIRTYFDSSTHDLYITNDGSDPTPSNS